MYPNYEKKRGVYQKQDSNELCARHPAPIKKDSGESPFSSNIFYYACPGPFVATLKLKRQASAAPLSVKLSRLLQ